MSWKIQLCFCARLIYLQPVRAARSAFFALAFFLNFGCGAKIPFVSSPARLNVRVAVDGQANADSPIPFDIVVVQDKQLAKSLASLEAGGWFAQKRQIRSDNPEESKLSVLEFEWTPGQSVPQIDRQLARKPKAILAFAGYSAPGAHRLVLAPNQPLTVELRESGARLIVPERGGFKNPFSKK